MKRILDIVVDVVGYVIACSIGLGILILVAELFTKAFRDDIYDEIESIKTEISIIDYHIDDLEETIEQLRTEIESVHDDIYMLVE